MLLAKQGRHFKDDASGLKIKKSIENADKLYQLISGKIITRNELRKMLGLKKVPSISPKKRD